MEELRSYARFLELEDSIPDLEAKRGELTAKVREAKLDYDWKDVELKNLENPGFFQRLFGKTEEKKEEAYLACREALAVWEAVKQELATVETQLDVEKQEQQTLTGSREAYERISREYTPEQKIAAFAPVAIQAANCCIEALEKARVWMQEDALRKGVRSGNRKYEFLARAERNARRLCYIRELFPSEDIPLGIYLKYPDSYIVNVTSEYKQLDRLNEALKQVRACRDAIKAMI